MANSMLNLSDLNNDLTNADINVNDWAGVSVSNGGDLMRDGLYDIGIGTSSSGITSTYREQSNEQLDPSTDFIRTQDYTNININDSVTANDGENNDFTEFTIYDDDFPSYTTTVATTTFSYVKPETSVELYRGALRITDINGGNSNDTLKIIKDIANSQYIISDTSLLLTTKIRGATGNLTNSITVPFAAVSSDVISILGLAGADEIIGSSANEVISGHAGMDTIHGNGGDDDVYGGDENDFLSGGDGKDFLIGGIGNDKLFGDNGDDVLKGNVGNDQLSGDSDNDLLIGGAGDDNLDGGSGIDTVQESGDFNFTLTNKQLIGNGTDTLTSIDQAILKGGRSNNRLDASAFSRGNVILQGGIGRDTLLGSTEHDVLSGGSENDTLTGGSGNDTLTGGTGKDHFRYQYRYEGTDSITDFNVLDDRIDISSKGFGGGLVAGVGTASLFVLGSSAQNASDRFIYDPSNGNLFFDVDGVGGKGQTHLATLSNQPNINASNILII